MREQRLAKPVPRASGGPCRALDGRRVAVCKLLIILDDTPEMLNAAAEIDRLLHRGRRRRRRSPRRSWPGPTRSSAWCARHGACAPAATRAVSRPGRRPWSRAEGDGSVTFLATLLIGIVAGSRSMMAPAAVAWAARLGWIDLGADLGELHGLALGGARSSRPWRWSSSSPTSCRPPRAARCRCSSAAASSPAPSAAPRSAPPPAATVVGLVLGAVGAVAGTLGGAELRGRMAAAFGSDRPAALIEDAGAIVLGLVAVGLA